MDPINEDDKPNNDVAQEVSNNEKQQAPEETAGQNVDDSTTGDKDDDDSEDDDDDLEDNQPPVEDKEEVTQGKEKQPKALPQAATGDREDEANESSDEEPSPIKQVDPRTWWQLHNDWLHVAMQAAMGNTTLKNIPDLDNIERVNWNPPHMHYEVHPLCTIVKRYDLCLHVQKGDDQVNLFHQVFTQWYNKVREVNNKAVLIQWMEDDHRENPNMCIENPTDIPTNLPSLKKFVHKLFLQTTGGEYHIQVLMGSEEDLSTIMRLLDGG